MADDPLKQAAARVFLAIPLHEIFRQEVENVLGPLRREIPDVRWVNPHQIHLTLHFFGAVSVKEIDLIHQSANKVASLFLPLTLSVTRLGGFPSLERPDVVWLGVEDSSGRMLSLQKAIQGEARSLGFRTEARPFQPHATIARIRKKVKDLGSSLANTILELPIPAKCADRFALYQSHSFPEGVRYEVLKTYPLSKKV